MLCFFLSKGISQTHTHQTTMTTKWSDIKIEGNGSATEIEEMRKELALGTQILESISPLNLFYNHITIQYTEKIAECMERMFKIQEELIENVEAGTTISPMDFTIFSLGISIQVLNLSKIRAKIIAKIKKSKQTKEKKPKLKIVCDCN